METLSLGTDRFRELRGLGFSQRMMLNLTFRHPLETKTFSTSEFRKVNNTPLKIVAVVKPDTERNVLAPQRYHLVDLSPEITPPRFSLQHSYDILRKNLHVIDWNDPYFFDQAGKPDEIMKMTERVKDRIKWLNEFAENNGVRKSVERLKLKFFADTGYGDLIGISDHSGLAYSANFKTLTMDTSMGLPHLERAIEMLVVKKLDNATPPHDLAQYVDEALKLPLPRKYREMPDLSKSNNKKNILHP